MALNIKNHRVEQLAEEIASLTGETKTEAILRALEKRRARLSMSGGTGDRLAGLRASLEHESWPLLPPRLRRKRLTKRQRETILGYGKEGA